MRHTAVIWRDVVLLTLLGFMTVIILLLPWINPGEAPNNPQIPGDVIVRASWPNNLDVDVDLWVKAPRDRPVGYSSESAVYFNLLRDDLGEDGDKSGRNYEVAYSRGRPAGQYAVNVVLYGDKPMAYPVPVRVRVATKQDHSNKPAVVLHKRVKLQRLGQELTVWQFTLDQTGHVVPSSINHRYIHLWLRKNG